MSTFRITYDGPALEFSEMDVRELAPALLAVGDLLEAATTVLYDGKVKPQVNVRGSFKTGSFGIDFSLLADWTTRMRDLLAGQEATAVANALAILGALGWIAHRTVKPGLFAVLKWLRGRPITRVDIDKDVAVIHVEEDLLEIEVKVLALLRSVAVRRATEKMLEPLSRPGVDELVIGDDEAFVVRVTNDEREWFTAPDAQEELLVDETRKMIFSIVSLAFKEDNKWRLHDGANTIHAVISDASFLARVDSNQIAFAKGDVLICEVRVRQWQTSSGAKTEYEVTKVLEHRMPGRQLSFPGIDEPRPHKQDPSWGEW